MGGVTTARLIAIFLALFFAGSSVADDWKEYDNAEYSFAIHFPIGPTIGATTYRAADGRSFAAHTFSVEQETGVFKVTVVEMPGEETGEDAVVVKDATKTAAEGGVIKFDIPHRVRRVYGRQLGIAGANGDYTYVALFYYKSRLCQIEGKAFVAVGRRRWTACASSSRSISPEPGALRASNTITHADARAATARAQCAPPQALRCSGRTSVSG